MENPIRVKTPSCEIFVESFPLARSSSWSSKEGLSYDKVMPYIERVLTPMELSYLMEQLKSSTKSFFDKKGYKDSRFYENGSDLWYHNYRGRHGEGNGSPYWSSYGMGYVVSKKDKIPLKFRGKFVIGKIGKVDMDSAETFPDYDDALILSYNEIKRMHGYLIEWEVRSDTGLAVPIGGRLNAGSLGEINLEKLMEPFQPIIVGDKDGRLTHHELITICDPRGRCGLWLRAKNQ